MRYSLTNEINKLIDRFPILSHLSRKKFLAIYILALINSRNVQFCETANHLNPEVKNKSNETRIQDFYRKAELNFDQIALLFFCIFPSSQKLDIVIDRTEWDFGKYQCNILMVVLSNRTLTLPFYWELLDNKSGNSNTENRIDLVKKCLDIILPQRISLFVGDRGFVGHHWFKYLKYNKINFCFRIPKHHNIVHYDEHMNKIVQKAEHLHQAYPNGITLSNRLVDGIVGNVYIGTGKDGELLFLFGNLAAPTLPKYYERRWTIESFFQNLKGRGFNLKITHLQNSEKLKKLIACVSLAYAFCSNTGLYEHRKIQKIKNKNHGRKSTSFARKGIDIIRDLLKQTELLDQLVEKFVRIICINARKIIAKSDFLHEKMVI
ncbi:transposase family protein [Bernardetia litoralis DSM 6794]|uniref:Transposase family protein n=1 Tax=Bernardetia litoralis (strain ATCC 23117 / DSM 6794 / NBRC 15988 / NCIMB 1366 / Fx l1 / Sio-4) TaxID=880071 RepID=I4AFV3_BERLS|nr:IS4 family transposase [Bernardetia litoralis]AFM02838.1 transposase family protein [Bernardetia litoralis DSM 6794]